MTESISQMETQTPKIRTYTYRWLIVGLYGLYAGASLYQINQYTIIENIVEKYYNTSSFLINLSQLVFMITLLILIAPSVYIIENIIFEL
ncbi:hypothetical protein HHI36_008524 [Cryptolaemus montrouzieri]|uniref:Uncharacterized protein n=1 Tax=Cryptolaemus montrouzieri TaxID=559131 RepID=A0ABD2MSN8_9CUCU